MTLNHWVEGSSPSGRTFFQYAEGLEGSPADATQGALRSGAGGLPDPPDCGGEGAESFRAHQTSMVWYNAVRSKGSSSTITALNFDNSVRHRDGLMMAVYDARTFFVTGFAVVAKWQTRKT